MSDEVPVHRAGYRSHSEPPRLEGDFSQINEVYARNTAQIAEINARNIEQIARLIKETHIEWLVYLAGVASAIDLIHNLWLFVRFLASHHVPV